VRYLSDAAIRKRAIIFYHVAQALSRNSDYQKDIEKLHSLGVPFDSKFGMADHWPSWDALAVSKDVCERSGLRLPMLPQALRRLTLDRLVAYHRGPIFKGMPGWAIKLKSRKAAARVLGPDPRPTGYRDLSPRTVRELRQVRPVPLKRLQKRHRGVSAGDGPPDDHFSQCWKVYDLRRQGKREREILASLWPEELPTQDAQRQRKGQADSSVKTPLRQRVYDFDATAKALIKAAYPPLPADRR
jgi:hypothetical protein